LSSKLAQVIEQIPRDVLYDFCCSYAQEHEELGMALVNEFWRPERDDYRSMVQQCLMHPAPRLSENSSNRISGEQSVRIQAYFSIFIHYINVIILRINGFSCHFATTIFLKLSSRTASPDWRSGGGLVAG